MVPLAPDRSHTYCGNSGGNGGNRDMGELTALGLKARLAALAKARGNGPVRIGAGAGLHLLVKPGQAAGTGAWVLRLTVGGKRRDMGLGAFPLVGLADARGAALAARRKAADGTDPITARADAKAALAPAAVVTFKAAALATIEAKRDGWSNAKHAAQWTATLEQHAFPKLGSKPVAAVDVHAVLEVLAPIWTTKPETASRLRQRIETVLDFASAKDWRAGDNPARRRGKLASLLAKQKAKGKRVQHHPALPWQQMPDFIAALDTLDGMGAPALRFAILAGARSGEVRGMRWREVDMAARVWAVPAGRMKMRELHLVPLSGAAMDMLAACRPDPCDGDALVFPGGRAGVELSDMTLSAVLRRMNGKAGGERPRWCDAAGAAVVPHGFRASFKSWTLAHGWPDHLSEKALAHKDNNEARAAYAREPLTEERRPMMEAWAALCTRAPASVASLDAARAAKMAI